VALAVAAARIFVRWSASLFGGQELFQVMLADQPAPPRLRRPELAGAQQVVD
jgi:hypothetical protein